tara:strand:+ start:1435 stop:1698 length:264 start_codon:yes stop_codon:yes gene_type:complete
MKIQRKNLIRRKYDFLIDVGRFNVGVNRDFELVLNYSTVNHKKLYETMKEKYPEYMHTNILVALTQETKLMFEDLTEDLTKFVNSIN